MNNRVAKRIRREVYGDMAFRGRKYRRRYAQSGVIIADSLRQKYQAAKRAAKGNG